MRLTHSDDCGYWHGHDCECGKEMFINRKANELDELIFEAMNGRRYKGERTDQDMIKRSMKVANVVRKYYKGM